MRLLLDTNVLIWQTTADTARLGDKTREVIDDMNNDTLISTVSIWEIAIKQSIGRLDTALTLEQMVQTFVQEARYHLLDINWKHAAGVRDLPMHHADPFDRLLISKAIVEEASLVTSDKILQRYDIPVIDARL